MEKKRVGAFVLVLCIYALAVVAEVESDPECHRECRLQQQLSDMDEEKCVQSCDGHEKLEQGYSQLWRTECLSRCVKHRRGQERQLCLFRCENQYRDTDPGHPPRDPKKKIIGSEIAT